MARIPSLSIEKLTAADAYELADFFEALAADAYTVRFFHPHPLTGAYARELCSRRKESRDLYFVARWRRRIAAYSLLRGWDDGYEIPSAGVCVHPGLRNAGLGHVVMSHAVEQARAAGASRIRLSVYKTNRHGVHVWGKFGYIFTPKNNLEWVGMLELTPPPVLPAVRIDVARLDAWATAPVWRLPARRAA